MVLFTVHFVWNFQNIYSNASFGPKVEFIATNDYRNQRKTYIVSKPVNDIGSKMSCDGSVPWGRGLPCSSLDVNNETVLNASSIPVNFKDI